MEKQYCDQCDGILVDERCINVGCTLYGIELYVQKLKLRITQRNKQIKHLKEDCNAKAEMIIQLVAKIKELESGCEDCPHYRALKAIQNA